MTTLKFYGDESIPLEMHKVRIVQKLRLPPVEYRLEAMTAAGNNTFLLQNVDVFMDMLTDSGVNAMSDQQVAAMMIADDSYAGSATYTRLEAKLREIFGMYFILPTHQGRACENILAQVLVSPGTVVPMNYHFTTTKAHITLNGGRIEELVADEGLEVISVHPFKGNMDIGKLRAVIEDNGPTQVAFVRMEAGTNLIGGQPFSLQNLADVSQVCREHDILLVMDASLLADNLYFIKEREEDCKDLSIREITRQMADLCDVIYFSARKLGCVRGGAMCMRSEELYRKMRGLVPLFEGFLTYGGMSVREIEALTVGLEETMDMDMINQGPIFIAYMVEELEKRGIPVITPAGARTRWHRGLRQHGTAAPGPAAPRLHPVPDQVRHRPHPVALGQPPPGRGTALHRGTGDPALLLWPSGTHHRLAAATGGQVPAGLRRQPVTRCPLYPDLRAGGP